jgi:ubiquinone/menaquinone biosynthesis C-methylase UbiE
MTEFRADHFAKHPVSYRGIRSRVERSGQYSTTVTEDLLALDGLSWDTDQNHIGGVDFVRRLAAKAKISTADRVLDIGCGLGGPIRLLSSWYQCKCIGIDISYSRIIQAMELTRWTDLSKYVHCIVGDGTALCFRSRTFDVIWGQNSWGHMISPSLMAETSRVAAIGGRLAMEEVCLQRNPQTPAEADAARDLQRIWMLQLHTSSQWYSAIASAGWRAISFEDLTPPSALYLRTILRSHPEGLPHEEERGLVLAENLMSNGVIGYFRATATLQ